MKLDGNYTKMLRTILNKSWRQHPTRHKLYGHLPHITKTIQVRRTRHARHCWRSKDELISDVLLWTPSYGQAKAGRPARTYIQQLCEDTGCNPEDLPEAMNNREKWKERVRDIRAGSMTWWFVFHFRLIHIRKVWIFLHHTYLGIVGQSSRSRWSGSGISVLAARHDDYWCCYFHGITRIMFHFFYNVRSHIKATKAWSRKRQQIKSKVGDRSRGWSEGYLFDIYFTKV